MSRDSGDRRRRVHNRIAARPEFGNLIDGSWQAGTGTGDLAVHDPATAEVLTTVRMSSAADVDAAVQSAAAAQAGWAATTITDRAAVLQRLAELCAQHSDELAELEVIDCGKPLSTARDIEMPGCLDTMRLATQAARVLSVPAAGEYAAGGTSFMRREALGVIAVITPWNYPLLEAVGKVFPALANGNSVVLKPAEDTPLSTTRFAALATQVLPPGVLNIVFGDGAVAGERLVGHPMVAMVSFTGSIATGRRVAAAAGSGLKKVVMELGGNAPVVLFADADLDAALQTIITAGLYNAGQDCMAASRLLVERTRYEEVVEQLARRCAAVSGGDTLDEKTTLGPLISERQRDRVEGKLLRRGTAQIVCGGGRAPLDGYFLEPTVVAGVVQEDELVQEEVFGPVFTVQPFDDEVDALALANGTIYGLAASVFTRDVGRGMRMTRALDAGTVWLNNHLLYGPDLPMCGFRQSGLGTEGSTLGYAEYTRVKHVAIDLGEGRS